MTKGDLTYHPTDVVQYSGEQFVALNDLIEVVVRIEVTTKGNGTLTVSRSNKTLLSIPIYDCHEESEESEMFLNDMLEYQFLDLNGDGTLDLQVRGTVVTVAGSRELKRRSLCNNFIYSVISERFESEGN